MKITLEDMRGADAPRPHYDRCRRPAGLSRRLQFPVSPETGLAPPCRTGALRREAFPISSIYRIFMLRVRTPVHVRFSRAGIIKVLKKITDGFIHGNSTGFFGNNCAKKEGTHPMMQVLFHQKKSVNLEDLRIG
jgi:hypothetical protein